MPSPLLHAAAGSGICLLNRRALNTNKIRFVIPVMLASILPDFDFVPGLIVGDPNRYHGGYSHSIGLAVVAALISGLILIPQRRCVIFSVFVAWTVHCLLDALTADGRPPYGVPLLWPVSDQTFHASVFASFQHGQEGATLREYFRAVFSVSNIRVLLGEIAIALPLLFGCAAIGRRVSTAPWRTRNALGNSSCGTSDET